MDKILDKAAVFMAIAGIIILESIALAQGINGTGIALAIAALAGLGGFKIGDMINKGEK